MQPADYAEVSYLYLSNNRYLARFMPENEIYGAPNGVEESRSGLSGTLDLDHRLRLQNDSLCFLVHASLLNFFGGLVPLSSPSPGFFSSPSPAGVP